MQVYKNILVTLDCSPVDDAIINHVVLLAVQNRAKVHLLHVVHAHTLDQRRALRAEAGPCLEKHAGTLREQGVDAHKIIRDGEPDEQILKEIETGSYDLVAMATHGHKFFGDILFGSVSKSLKHKIGIPLLLLKP
ncbi:MAG TPA: universal stress protein [Pontiellaceae bacterium]|nr:universal stress protein [Pontiellaceae bacterium]HPR83009.1 universal stress protein [Pontiellaceae bacterium]